MSEDMAKPDYEQLCEEYEHKIEELNKQIEELQRTVKDSDRRIDYMAKVIARLKGYIDGLKFSIRCNGVSGGEVKEVV